MKQIFKILFLGAFFYLIPLLSTQLLAQVPEEIDDDKLSSKMVKVYTLKTEHFNIHYPEALTNYVNEIAQIAKEAFDEVTKRLNWTPKGKIQLVLNNQSDAPNGFAQVSPYNNIHIFVAPPNTSSSLDHYHNYWRLLIQHELTHIVHIDQHHGIVTPFRKIFGKLPLIHPNALSPVWMREGMAVYEESKIHPNFGRNNSPYTDMVLRTAVLENNFPKIDEVNGSSSHFPGGSGPYLFGGKFFDYLAETYGEDKMYEYQKKYASSLWIYSANHKAKKVYGKKFKKLWNEFTLKTTESAKAHEEKITLKGLTPLEPILEPEINKSTYSFFTLRPNSTGFAYFDKNFDNGLRIVIYPETDEKPIVIKKNAVGQMSFSKDGRYLAFSAFTGSSAGFNPIDVYLYDLQTKKMGRLFDEAHKSKSGHNFDPDWSSLDEGKRWLVMVNQNVDTDQLLIFDAVEKKSYIITNEPAKTQFSNPRFSSDGQMIVVSRKSAQGQRDIVVYSKLGKLLYTVTNDAKPDDYPIFSKNDHEIYFSAYESGVSNIYAFNLRNNATTQITQVLSGVFQPTLSRNGQWIHVEHFSTYGNAIRSFYLPKAYKNALSSKPKAYFTKGTEPKLEDLGVESFTYYQALTSKNKVVDVLKYRTDEQAFDKEQEEKSKTETAAEIIKIDELSLLYTKNRRGKRDVDLKLPWPPKPVVINVKTEPETKPEETASAEEPEDCEEETTPAPKSNKDKPSLYKDALSLLSQPFELPQVHPTGAKAYKPLKGLYLPRYVMPNVTSTESATLFSLTTGNYDPLQTHNWNLSVNYRTDASFLGGSGIYLYRRFKPNFFVGGTRYAVDWGTIDDQNFFEKRWQGFLGTTFKLHQHRFTLSYFYEDRAALTENIDSILLLNMQPYAGTRLRYTFGRWKEFTDSVSQENGFLFKAGLDIVDSAFGSHDVNEELVSTLESRFYLEMPWFEHHVLGLRLMGGYKWGDPQVNGVFRLGGPFGEGVGTVPLSNRVFPFRGLPGIALAGDQAVLGTLEYRLPLFNGVRRGISTWPVYLDKFHLSFFADAADITYTEYDSILRIPSATESLFSRIMIAPGVELKTDLVLGFGLPITSRLGYAVILTNVDRVDALTDSLTGTSIKNGTFYWTVGTSF